MSAVKCRGSCPSKKRQTPSLAFRDCFVAFVPCRPFAWNTPTGSISTKFLAARNPPPRRTQGLVKGRARDLDLTVLAPQQPFLHKLTASSTEQGESKLSLQVHRHTLRSSSASGHNLSHRRRQNFIYNSLQISTGYRGHSPESPEDIGFWVQ